MKRYVLIPLLIAISSAFACTADDSYKEKEEETQQQTEDSGASSTDTTEASDIEWSYDKSTDTYYVVGILYCDNPADKNYEQMGIFVPGAYMKASANSNGTYKCSVNSSGKLNGFSAATAPVVIPVNTPGYKAMSPPSGFSSGVTSYTKKGFIYLHAGCRGKDAAAPSAVTDLKAAIRYFRYLCA